VEARLVTIAGPVRESVFPLSQDEVSIGRDQSNDLPVGATSVASRHCLIRKTGGRFTLLDLGSGQGTFVNGLPVTERVLADGDEIAIGDCLLAFFAEDAAPAPRSAVEFHAPPRPEGSGIGPGGEQALYLDPKETVAGPRAELSLARHLNALLKIATRIGFIHDLESLQWQLLGELFELIPADRGAILLRGPDAGDFENAWAWDRSSGLAQPVQVDRSITDRVLKDGVAALVPDARGEGAVLCGPLQVGEKVLGLIYLEAGKQERAFNQDHLQLLMTVGGIAALALENARHLELLHSENQRLRAETHLEHNMVGESPAMRELYHAIARVAPTGSTILLCGESGTGKELVAQAIHRNSPRAGRPFVAINCAALTESLLESELFGHERGAFTGAVAQKRGQLEVAEGGTLFLDEIAELAPGLQAKLLRALQTREFLRVGGLRAVRVDIRLIAATNRDLAAAVRAGAFRQDLFYRLNVVALTLPPLRERRQDIPLLASYFAAKYAEQCKRALGGISPEAQKCLLHYGWPGNVRELENAMERAVVLGASDTILPEDLPETILETQPAAPSGQTSYHAALQALKKEMILKAVEQTRGNYSEAARLLGLHPNYLHRLIRNLDLRPSLKKFSSDDYDERPG